MLAERLSEAIAKEFHIDGKSVRTGFTTDISVCPHNGADAASLLANAGAALFRAKAKSRATMSRDGRMDPAQGLPRGRIMAETALQSAVNLSPAQFVQGDVVSLVHAILIGQYAALVGRGNPNVMEPMRKTG